MVVNSSQVWRHPFLFICACASCSALNLYSTFWQPINHQGLQVEKERENPVCAAWKRGNLGKQSAQHLWMWTRSRVLCMMPLLMLHNTKGGVYKLPQHVNNILWMKDARGKRKGINTCCCPHGLLRRSRFHQSSYGKKNEVACRSMNHLRMTLALGLVSRLRVNGKSAHVSWIRYVIWLHTWRMWKATSFSCRRSLKRCKLN